MGVSVFDPDVYRTDRSEVNDFVRFVNYLFDELFKFKLFNHKIQPRQ